MTGIIGHWYRVEISEVETCFNGGLRAALADLTIIPRSFDGADPVPMRLYHIKDGYLYTPRHWGTQHFGAGKRITTLPKPAASPYPKIPTPRVGQEQFFNDTFRAAMHYRMFSVKAATGSGKCHGKGTEVIMFDGRLKKVEDIVVGDYLMGTDSSPRRVLSLGNGASDMFRITPVKGDSFTVNREHILSLMVTGGCNVRITHQGVRYYGGDIIDITVDDYLTTNNYFKHCTKLFRPNVIHFRNRSTLEIPPYILGVWLGDGHSRSAAITSMDDEVITEWCAFGTGINKHHYIRIVDEPNNKSDTYFITVGRTNKCGANLFRQFLIRNNLITNKHIPHQYKTSSLKDRLELLAGLIDTDGYVSNNCFEIAQKYESLADDICFIARSVGIRATKSVKNVNGVDYYRMMLSGDIDKIPVKVARRIPQQHGQIKNPLLTGFSIEDIGRGEYYGFTLDGDHRYLLSDFIVTHNTVTALQTIARLGVEALVVVPTDALIRQWVRQIEDKLGLTPSQIGRVQQDKCDYVGKHITVASMQSLYSRDYGKDFYRYHGAVVFDELHTLNAQEMSRVLGKFYADVQIGQTATHKRKDGRDKVTELWFGKPAVVAVGAPVVDVTVTPVVIQHQQRATSMSRNVLVSILAMNQHRNARLTGMLNKLYADGKVVLGISDSVKQLQIIHAALISQYGIPAEQVGLFVGETYTGNDKLIIGKIHNFNPSVLKEYVAEVQEHFQHMEYTVSANTARFTVVGKRLTIAARNAICARLSELSGVPIAVLSAASAVRQEKKKTSNGYVDAILQDTGMRIYLATYGVMAMGVDVPWLDAGIDLTPRTEPEQVLGRVRRQYDGKRMAHWFSPVDKGFSRIIENINSARLKAYTAIAGVHLQGQRG